MRKDQPYATRLRYPEVFMMQSQAVFPDTVGALKCELAAEVLRSSGRLRLCATGWSMLPTVWPGDTIEIEHVSSEYISTGDIALFGREGRLFIHRVVGKDGDLDSLRMITQGDGMAHPDPPVAASELLGKVSIIWRAGKWIEPRPSLSLMEKVTAFFVRHSSEAARVLVYFHNTRHLPQEQVTVCQS